MTPNESNTRIVAVGASAGGLEALSRLLSNLEPGLGCAYVVLQHLSPNHRSMLVDILSRETRLPVVALTDAVAAAPDTVYVVPAGSNAEIVGGLLRLTPVDPEISPKPSINRFLLTLAAERRDDAVGVILSGTGSDGAAGLRAVAEAGGLALVQQSDSAKYEGMPVSAILAGAVAFVGTPEEIALRLPALLSADPAERLKVAGDDGLGELLALISARAGIDFSGYKAGTILRRLRHRQDVVGMESIPEYTAWVRENPGELEVLSREMLISVTSFFRDPSAFEMMRFALERVVATTRQGAPLRLWVAGCATGEEAYTLAIILAQLLDAGGQRDVQIFATDIEEQVLSIARKGVYPASALRDVPREVVDRFFRPVEEGYEVGSQLRDMIVFARHNLVSDPPFLRLDAISCRNVMIYFDTALQARVLAAFHFALDTDGVLLLGKSESTASMDSLFSTINREARIYRKVPGTKRHSAGVGFRDVRRPTRGADSISEQLLMATAKSIGATVILCDRDGNIAHTAGQVNTFLKFPPGAARLTLTESLVPELRSELLTMLHHFRNSAEPQRSRRRRVGDQVIRVLLEPVSNMPETNIAIVITPADADPGDSDSDVGTKLEDRVLEDELLSTREHLHALLEEMAASNEEMQALNEESQAANEELQATNEELEASNEELQATNEELVSLNEEFNIKAAELARLGSEYAHLYESLPFGLLVFDELCRLSRVNRFATGFLDITRGSLGHSIRELHLPSGLAGLDLLVDRAAKTGVGAESEMECKERTLQVQVTPALDEAGRVITIIVNFADVTDIRRAQQHANESDIRLQALLETAAVLYAIKSPSGAYLYANQPFMDAFGLVEPPTGSTDFDVLPPELAADMWSADLESLRSTTPIEREHTVRISGSPRILASRHQVLHQDAGPPLGFVFEATDVSVQRQAEAVLRVTATVFEQATEAIIITGQDGRIQTCNAAFEEITEFSADDVIGASLDELFGAGILRDPDQSLRKELLANGHWRGEVVQTRKGGENYPAWITISSVEGDPGRMNHYVAVFSDISRMQDVQRRTEFLSTHDELTRLPNRALFSEMLDEAIAECVGGVHHVALLFIDIDHFKNINDMLGHPVGDEVLTKVAHRIRSVLGEEHQVGRFGGDEFVAIIRALSREDIEALSNRLVAELANKYDVNGNDIFSSASIGVAFYPGDGDNGEELLNAADSAMYHAKALGRDRVALFHPSIRERLLRDAAIERGLRRSMHGEGYRLLFQPIFELADQRHIVGLEALLRWHDAELADVGPAEFIPVAEQCGLVVSLDRMVRTMVLDQISAWRGAGLDVPVVSINVSPWSLREHDFAEQLLDAMSVADISGSLLKLEITESALLHYDEHLRNNLALLSAAGIRFVIDDFGVGYSSLTYLRQLPLSELKIDRSFVSGFTKVAEDEMIALAILGLANSLALTTVAEGIETEEQRMWLEGNGFRYGQGYLLSRPLELLDTSELLGARS